jgi:hypothetical protein
MDPTQLPAARRAYACVAYDDDFNCRKVTCWPSRDETCYVATLQSANRETRVHDSDLARCTEEINATLANVKENNREPGRELALLRTPRGLFLAWVDTTEEIEMIDTLYGRVGNFGPAFGPDDPRMEQMLGISP